MKYPVFDLHCDTVLGLMGKDLLTDGSLRQNNLHIDLERAKEFAGYAQCFACFTTPSDQYPQGKSVEDIFELELSVLLREINAHSDLICQAYTAEDIENNLKDGKMSAILTIEGPAGFSFDPDLLENLYQIGFRITTLGWNERNVLTGSNVTGGGLTALGREYVNKAQDLGMIVDVSHISDEAFWDIMDMTRSPIIASHSNSRHVCTHKRNLTDDMFLAICKTGGVTGVNLYTDFLGENADLDTVCDHVFHFLELDPDGKHISLGGDLDGCDTLPKGFSGIQSFTDLAERLVQRGLSEPMIHNIFWNNALGVIKSCCI